MSFTAQHAGSSAGWRASSSGGSVHLSIPQAVQLVIVSSRQFGLLIPPDCQAWLPVFFVARVFWENSQAVFTVSSWGGRSLVNLVSFRHFLKVFWVVYYFLSLGRMFLTPRLNLAGSELVPRFSGHPCSFLPEWICINTFFFFCLEDLEKDFVWEQWNMLKERRDYEWFDYGIF